MGFFVYEIRQFLLKLTLMWGRQREEVRVHERTRASPECKKKQIKSQGTCWRENMGLKNKPSNLRLTRKHLLQLKAKFFCIWCFYFHLQYYKIYIRIYLLLISFKILYFIDPLSHLIIFLYSPVHVFNIC